MKHLGLLVIGAALALAGCSQNPSDDLLKQIAASTKETAELTKQIAASTKETAQAQKELLAAVAALKPDPAVLETLRKISESTTRSADAIAKIIPAKPGPLAIPSAIENRTPEETQKLCETLGYSHSTQYTNDPRWWVCY